MPHDKLLSFQVEQKKMIFGIVTRIDLLNFIKENDEDADGDVFRSRNGSSSTTTPLTNKMEAMRMMTTKTLGNGDAFKHTHLVNGHVNGANGNNH